MRQECEDDDDDDDGDEVCVWVAPLSAEGRSGGCVWCVVGKVQHVGVLKDSSVT